MGKLSCDLRALRGGWIYGVLGVWGIVVVALLGWLTAYSYAPGMQDVPPRLADIALPVKFTSDRHRLLMAVHAGGRPERRTARVFGCAIHADATPPDG